MKYTCPVCGFLVFNQPPGSFEICPICGWEDDNIQLRFPDLGGGANKASLVEAQQNYKNIGMAETRYIEMVRSPFKEDDKDVTWRTVDPQKDNFENSSLQEYPLEPEDKTQLYYWRDNFWRKK